MAFVVKYKRLSTGEDGTELSPAAKEIFNRYVADGLLEADHVSTLAGNFVYLRFTTQAVSEQYFAEMSAIAEIDTTGEHRTDFTSYEE